MTSDAMPNKANEGIPIEIKPALVLLDWGNTLMHDDPQRPEPMCEWPRVAAVPGAAQALQWLAAQGIRCGVASNARHSDEAQIRAALARVGLATYIDPVFCWRNTGAEKGNPQFWFKLLKRVQLPAVRVVMIGDQFDDDVRVPAARGLAALWLNRNDPAHRTGPGYSTLHDWAELPRALQSLCAAR